MTLRKRLDRLEGATEERVHGPCVIVRSIVQPGGAGPELVAMTLRPLHGGVAVQVDRTPGGIKVRTRFAAMCHPDQRMKGV